MQVAKNLIAKRGFFAKMIVNLVTDRASLHLDTAIRGSHTHLPGASLSAGLRDSQQLCAMSIARSPQNLARISSRTHQFWHSRRDILT